MREIGARYFMGSREAFGLEFALLESRPAPFGYVGLFIKGFRIGRPDDPTFIYSLLSDLEWIAEQRAIPDLGDEVFGLSSREAWALLQSSGAHYRVSPIEIFDDYEIFAVRRADEIRFLWSPVHDTVEGSVGPMDAIVGRNEVATVAQEFRDLYSRLRDTPAAPHDPA